MATTRLRSRLTGNTLVGAAGPKRKNPWAFTPYNPVVPTGSYDPALDAQLGATQRGLADTQADTQTQGLRNLSDYGIGSSEIQRQLGQTQADLSQSMDRQESQHALDTAGLTRQYNQLASQQQERQNAAGVLQGGAVLASAAARNANSAIQQSAIDLQNQQARQDYNTRYQRATTDAADQQGHLGLNYQRITDDAGTALTRAQREATQFGIDTNSQKLFQASQMGYVAPTRPKNEFTSPGGAPYRVVMVGKKPVYVDPTGRRLPRRPA